MTIRELADDYINCMGEGEESQLALLACAPALRLDDATAEQAIELIAGSNGHSRALVRQVKRLLCVWRQWDGSWCIGSEVRRELEDRLRERVPAECVQRLHSLLADRADSRAATLGEDGQLTAYRKRQAETEAGLQMLQVPERSEAGGRRLLDTWQEADAEGRRAVQRTVDHLGSRLEGRVTRHTELCFFRGMAAHDRGAGQQEERYFRPVWEEGRRLAATETPARMYAIAAHLLGLVVRDRMVAEQAFQDSLAWNPEPAHKAQVLHSYGNLLAGWEGRWGEAEPKYQESLALDNAFRSRAQVLHSYGNLLAEWGRREASEGRWEAAEAKWQAAEGKYEESLRLNDAPWHRGQVHASWADAAIALDTPAGNQTAREQSLLALEVDPHTPKTVGVAHRVLSNVYEREGDLARAIAETQLVAESNRSTHNTNGLRLSEQRIAWLRRQLAARGQQPRTDTEDDDGLW